MTLERIFDQISPEPNSGCWLWLGYVNKGGYGTVYHEKKMHKAHRLIYQAVRGPIPPSLQLDHLCRVRCCVNPSHLEPVTLLENIRRGESGYNRKKQECKHGHPFTADNTLMRGTERCCRACRRAKVTRWRRKHGVPQGTARWHPENETRDVDIPRCCAKCGVSFMRPRTDGFAQWRKRKYCSYKCFVEAERATAENGREV